MARVVALQMDPLERINPRSDTTLLLGEEAQRRGYALWHYTPDTLSLQSGVLSAEVAELTLLPGDVPGWNVGERSRRSLEEASFVLLRQDPPFDMSYISSTYLLEQLPASVKVLNDPFHVRNNPEKLFPLQFPQFIPPSCVTSRAAELEAFHREHGDIVVKPLYGFGGHGVFRLKPQDANAGALFEMLLSQRDALVVAQPFLPEVESQEKRIVLINGKVEGVIGRIPAAGEIRSNMRVGGTPVASSLTPRQQEICDALAPVLREKGLLLVGLDVIGDWLNEINITSPTGLRALKAIYGTVPEHAFWNAAEAL